MLKREKKKILPWSPLIASSERKSKAIKVMLELGYKVSAAQSCPGGMHLLLLFHFALFFFPLFPLLLFFFKIQVRLSLCCLRRSSLLPWAGAVVSSPSRATSLLARVFMFNVRESKGQKGEWGEGVVGEGGSFAKHGWEALIEPLESGELLMSQHIHGSTTSESNPNSIFFLFFLLPTPPRKASAAFFSSSDVTAAI